MTKSETVKLQKEVRERKFLISKIVHFVQKIVSAKGRVTSRREGSSNTHIVSEFALSPFLFRLDTGQTMFGGNDVVVHYKGAEVCRVHWQVFTFSPKEAEVRYFERRSAWLQVLKRWMDDPKLIERKLEEQARKRKRKEVLPKPDKQAILKTEAERWKVV